MQANDINCVGDALIQGDMKVNGKLNNEIIDVDSNCLIIDVCRRLDLSTVGNKIEIDLPDGYTCNPTSGTTIATFDVCTYGSDSSTETAWTTNAVIDISYTLSGNISRTTQISNLNKNDKINVTLTPYLQDKVIFTVSTAAAGGTKFYAVISSKIICHKD